MNHLIISGLLLANRTRIEQLSAGFRANQENATPQDLLVGLTVLVGTAAALLLLLRILDRCQRGHRHVNRPLRLFLTLCKAHELTWPERWLLWRVARAQRLRDPGRLFLEPERLDPTNLSPSLRLHGHQLRQIRERLFRGIAGEEPAAAIPTVSEAASLSAPPSLDELARDTTPMPSDQSWAISTWLPLPEITTEDTATLSPPAGVPPK